MTMTIPPKTEEINIVNIDSFSVDVEYERLIIKFSYGYKDSVSNLVTSFDTDIIVFNKTEYLQLLNATPPGNKTFKEWIRPAIYNRIANYLGVPVGQID